MRYLFLSLFLVGCCGDFELGYKAGAYDSEHFYGAEGLVGFRHSREKIQWKRLNICVWRGYREIEQDTIYAIRADNFQWIKVKEIK